MATESFETDLKFAEKSVYNKCGFQLQNLVWNSESANYGLSLITSDAADE